MNTWHNKKLKDIVTFVSGNTPDTKNEAFWNGKIPWVSAKDLKQFHIKSSIDSLSEQGKQVASLVPANTILILVRGMMLHRDFPVCISSTELAINQDLKGLIPKEAVDPLYLAYALQKDKKTILDHVESSGHGTGKLDTSFLKELEIIFPDSQIQKSITSILSTWDFAIEKIEQLIEKKKQKKTALAQKLLSDCVVHNPIQTEWRMYHLGDLFSERSEVNRPDLSLLSITQNDGVILRNDTGRKDTSSEDKSKYLRICPGDIGYNTMRMWQGVSACSTIEGIVSPAYTICVPKNLIDAHFASHVFKYSPVINLFYRYSQGLTSDTWNLKFCDFSEIAIRIPKKQLQRRIAKIFLTVDEEIALLKRRQSLFSSQKSFLMNKLLSGEWEPPELEQEATT